METLLYSRIRKAAENRGMSLKAVAEEFDKKFDTVNIYNSLKRWGSKNDPTATNLCRLSEVLDCDIDYLMGKQDIMRKDVFAVMEETGLTFQTAENIMKIVKNNPDTISIINDLFTDELEDPDTGKKIPCASSLLLHLIYLCKIDLGNPIMTGYMAINDPYSKNYYQEVNTAEYFQFDRHRLYIDLCNFIDQQRAKKALHLYHEL